MHKGQLIRLCGLGSLIGGILEIAVRIPQYTTFGDEPISVIARQKNFIPILGLPSLAASILILFGIIGVYMHHAGQSGVLGLGAFLVAFLGLTLSIGANWTYAFVSPVLAMNAPYLLGGDPAGQGLIRAIMVSYLTAQVGLLILGVSMLVTGVFPKWVSLTLIGSIIAVGLLSPWADTRALRFLYNSLIGIGPIVTGYFLYKTPSENEIEAGGA